jgi:hypothetical protein
MTTVIITLPFLWYTFPFLETRLDLQTSFGIETENRSLTEREALNREGNQLFVENALTGVGLGTSPIALREQNPDFPYDYQPPHVALLAVSAETGLFGALFYLWALVGPWLSMGMNRRRLTFTLPLLGLSAALLALTLIGLFDYYTWLLVPGRLLQYLAWGLWGMVYLSQLEGPSVA